MGHEWIIERHLEFSFRGPSGNPAIADLVIVTRDGSLPVVVATERDDNPGVSITNGAEQLAAQVLTRLFPEHIGEQQPFRIVEHYRPGAFDSTMMEMRFKDFTLQEDGASPRIGDVIEWRNLDARVAKVLAQQTTVQRIDEVDQRHAERLAIEPPKKSRGMHR